MVFLKIFYPSTLQGCTYKSNRTTHTCPVDLHFSYSDFDVLYNFSLQLYMNFSLYTSSARGRTHHIESKDILVLSCLPRKLLQSFTRYESFLGKQSAKNRFHTEEVSANGNLNVKLTFAFVITRVEC